MKLVKLKNEKEHDFFINPEHIKEIGPHSEKRDDNICVVFLVDDTKFDVFLTINEVVDIVNEAMK